MYDAHRLRSPDDDRGGADRSIEIARPEGRREWDHAQRHVDRRVTGDSLALSVLLAWTRAFRGAAGAGTLAAARAEEGELHTVIVIDCAEIW
ncbi:MAG TPA: hypothetical protein VGM88_12000 [Kofleriaceae bacterium]|jgi:hypothetical protein